MGLFDSIRSFFGASKPAPLTEPSGTDGIVAPGGYLWRGETNASLVGHRLWLTISDAITNTIVVSAAARLFLNLIAGTEWDLEGDDQGAVDLIRSGLYEADMAKPWSAVVRKAALYKFYGFSMHEWVIRRRSDGLLVYADIAHRPQYTIRWWDKPTEREPLLGVVQQTRLGNRYYLPRNRLFYCVDDTLDDDPAGLGLLRHVVPKISRLNRYEQLEGIGFETDLRGVPYGKAPIKELKKYAAEKKLGDAWVEEQLKCITDFGDSHVRTTDLSIVLDSSAYTDREGHPTGVPQWTLELLKGDGAPLAEVAAAINRVNLEIARVIGAEFMLMGGSGGQSGNRAMHGDKTDQFGKMIQATLVEIAGYARNDLARTLVALNGKDPDMATPKLLPGNVDMDAAADVAQTLLYMAQAGAPLMPGDPAIDQIRARLHLAEQPKLTPEVAGVLPRTGAKPGAGLPPKKPDDSVDVDLTDLEDK